MSGLSTIFKMAVKAAAAPNKKLLDMKYTRETPKTKGGFSSVDLAAEGKITDQQAIGGMFNPISFGKDGMKVGKDASNLNTSRIEISTFDPASTPGPLGFGMKSADDIGLPASQVGNKTKDAIKVQTNLIEGSKWKWEGKPPKGFEKNTHLVSMQGGSKLKKASGGPTDHSYATKVIYEKGGNLSTYDTRAEYVKELHKSIPESLAALKIKIPKEVEKLTKELKAEGKSTEEIKKKVDALKKKLTRDYKGDNPKGKPTTVGVPEFGKKIGKIKKGGIIQPVYDQIIMREEGGQVMPMQYGGGLSDAYSTLSDRRQNQNMYGMGDTPMQQMPSQMSSVFQDPMEASAFSPVNMEKGGDIVVPKERMINDQPHQLSYINPEEAGLLKALGGSGRRVDGIPAYFSGEEGTDMDDDIGESFSGGDMSGSDDSGQDDLSTFLGESSLADAFGTPSDPIGPGEGFEAGPDDTESTSQALASYMRANPQGFMNRATDKKGDFRSQQVADLVQAAADRGNLQGVGIPFANAMEKAGLASFGKGMRSSLEAFTPGKALTRNDYDPEVLAGNVDLSENQNKVAIQAFGDGIRYSKSGDSIADVTAQMSALGFTEDQINNAAQAFGYSPNSTAQASQVYDSLNDARIDGALQGFGLAGSMLTSPISGFSSLGRGFYGQRDEKGNPIEKSVMDRVGDEVMQTDLGKSISGSISDTLGKDSKAGEIASTIGKGIGMINDPFGTILGQRGIRQTSVPNILEATPDNRYFSGPSSETPSGLEKGISSIVDFFGGPQAAYRNNIDVRQGEGQDTPVSRRPRINEPVESATASSSGSNDGRLMNKFFAGLAATDIGKKSSGEGSIFRLIKSQNPQLTDDQIRAMIPNENNFA